MKWTSEKFYNIIRIIADFLVDAGEGVIKTWLKTQLGGRVFAWFIDKLVSKFYDDIIDPLVRVGVIRMGYYYDVNDAEFKIKRLRKDANNEELYLRTLNDIRRKLPQR